MLPELKTFVSLVESDNIENVIKKFKISKATVYEHIKYLELYFRTDIACFSTSNELIITDGGQRLYRKAKQIFNIIDNSFVDLIQVNNSIIGNINIGANITLEEYVLPRFFSYFIKKYPNINLKITTDEDENIYKKLKHNEVDIGLIEELPPDINCKQTRLLKDKMVLIIPYADTIKDISSYINEFKSKRWIVRQDACSTQKFTKLFLKENNISPENIIMLGSNYAIKEAVKNNLGISIISKFVADSAYRNDEICVLPLEECYERYFSYILNKDNNSECLNIFIDELKAFSKRFYKLH